MVGVRPASGHEGPRNDGPWQPADCIISWAKWQAPAKLEPQCPADNTNHVCVPGS